MKFSVMLGSVGLLKLILDIHCMNSIQGKESLVIFLKKEKKRKENSVTNNQMLTLACT